MSSNYIRETKPPPESNLNLSQPVMHLEAVLKIQPHRRNFELLGYVQSPRQGYFPGVIPEVLQPKSR